MLRRTPVLLCEALDFLEASNDTLLAGWAAIFLLSRSELGQLCRQMSSAFRDLKNVSTEALS